MIRFFAALLLFAAWSQIAQAQTLFSDDFQDGDTGNWKGNAGKGDIRLTRYKKNISMRLQHDAYAIIILPTKNYKDIFLSVDFAAENLKSKDYCILETSIGGDKWTEIGRVSDGQDDAISLHNIFGKAPKAVGLEFLAVRLRISAGKDNASCWADNVRVSGRIGAGSLARDIPLSILNGAPPLSAPYAAQAFARPADASAAHQGFQGRLRLAAPQTADGFVILKDDFGYEKATGKLKFLPGFAIDFVSDGDAIIPVQRGPQKGSHPDWEWIFEPGQIWSEAGDDGWNRASLPIALQERNANCIHNGLMSFAFKYGEISDVVVQIGSETCAYLQFDMWSKLEVGYEPEISANAEKVTAAYQAEIARRLPRKPVNMLAGTDISQIGSPAEITPGNMTAFAFAAGGQVYAGECNTRHGLYPYCASMVLPSYSMAKSIAASIGLMRLEKLYPGARSAHIADYVPECSAKNWGDVTFEQALDMTTGNYTSKVYDADESSPKTWKFMSEETHAGKIKQACNVHARRSEPGREFVYHTTDTYILGTAMQAYLRQKTGNPKADVYDDILRPIWREQGLSPLLDKTRRTYDAVAQPFIGWGLTLQADDLVRIAHFLRGGGKIAGVAWLDEDLLKSALQQNADDRGLRAISDSLRYRAGFWAYNAGPFLGCKGDMWIPNMSGFGGLATVLMPNGHVYFYVSDGHEYAWRRAAKAANQLKSFCEMK